MIFRYGKLYELDICFLGGLEFTVLEVEDRRVGKVKCTRAPELNPENDDDEEEDA